jgi:hypothetical protein
MWGLIADLAISMKFMKSIKHHLMIHSLLFVVVIIGSLIVISNLIYQNEI